MSIFSVAESGTSFHRSRFSKSISNRMDYDCQFHQLVPVLKRFVLPGDIWKIGGDVLVRFHPMLSPTLTPNNFRVRYFFVPLRLVEPDTELIITGSKEGKLYTGTLPTFPNFLYYADTKVDANANKVSLHTFWDYMNVQASDGTNPYLDYTAIKNDACLPAAYWRKGYNKICYEFYDDENRGPWHANNVDYDAANNYILKLGGNSTCYYTALSKDYFTSSLPWQLKGVAPSITLGVGSVDFTNSMGSINTTPGWSTDGIVGVDSSGLQAGDAFNTAGQITNHAYNTELLNALNAAQVSLTGSLDMDDIRTMAAQTRLFERLARCGSRYTEYLKANFGLAPADDTLQRPQYLGGWKVPIVTTEVLQTAADGTNPVGTMRGHGITRGGQQIKTFYAKEFGMLFGLAEIRPDVQYTTGIPRQLTYKSRFDFFNPSFQHLSEQEVRNGEIYISNSDGQNDNTFGFQAYANELRTCQNETVGDLRYSLSFWNQALHFTTRPNLNYAFIQGSNHLASFNAPFAVNGPTAYPIIVQFYNRLDVYRPMVRYATPGQQDQE